jgi:DNA replication and repair protein RecF
LSIKLFRAEGFRCLAKTELVPDPRLNVITGPNASGKSSLLEGLFYLGRGRSFRGSGNRELIQSGAAGFTLFGEVSPTADNLSHKLGVEIAVGERRVRIDGGAGNGADLAQLLPVQVIDPEIHELVHGGPEFRRRFLDWGVFHVKHQFLETWRCYQKTLRQRNAALRQGEADAMVRAWDSELIQHGERVDMMRTEFLDAFLPLFSSIVSDNLSFDSNCIYKRGWSANSGLEQALEDSWSRDRAFGSTQVGPHRADLNLQFHDRRARHRVSRGQQKMLGAALVIAQTRFVAEHSENPLVLLVDDPAAELDRDNRGRLFEMLKDVPAQMFVTALEPGDLPEDLGWEQGEMFHVEHGKVSALV